MIYLARECLERKEKGRAYRFRTGPPSVKKLRGVKSPFLYGREKGNVSIRRRRKRREGLKKKLRTETDGRKRR